VDKISEKKQDEIFTPLDKLLRAVYFEVLTYLFPPSVYLSPLILFFALNFLPSPYFVGRSRKKKNNHFITCILYSYQGWPDIREPQKDVAWLDHIFMCRFKQSRFLWSVCSRKSMWRHYEYFSYTIDLDNVTLETKCIVYNADVGRWLYEFGRVSILSPTACSVVFLKRSLVLSYLGRSSS
jgi:hypothetical protein